MRKLTTIKHSTNPNHRAENKKLWIVNIKWEWKNNKFTAELDRFLSIKSSYPVPERKNEKQSRNKSGDTQRQNDGAFEVDEPATRASPPKKRRRLLLLHHWQLLIIDFSHFHRGIRFGMREFYSLRYQLSLSKSMCTVQVMKWRREGERWWVWIASLSRRRGERTRGWAMDKCARWVNALPTRNLEQSLKFFVFFFYFCLGLILWGRCLIFWIIVGSNCESHISCLCWLLWSVHCTLI